MQPEPELSNLISPTRAGLLVIDVQEKLLPHIDGGAAAAQAVNRSIRAAAALKIPILSTEQYVRGLGPTVPEVCSALEEAAAPPSVEKFSFSCFGEPNFVERFAASGIDTLAICGIETHVCVLQTALEGLDRGIDVFVLSDAVGSRCAANKTEALSRMKGAGCIVGSLEMFVFEIMRTAKHEAFRAVQKIIV